MALEYKVEMPYQGYLSKNSSKFLGGRGLKPFVRMWMSELQSKVQALNVPLAESYKISLYGKFTDERRPDLANLHEVIGDALKGPRALIIDDKNFIFEDKGWELGHFDPTIVIFIEPLGLDEGTSKD